MYKPTPRQIEVYGLEKTQGRYYEKEEIFAGTFRANNGRECGAVLRDGAHMNRYNIFVDDDGTCWIAACKNPSVEDLIVLVFTAHCLTDDMDQEQRKIQNLTIYPEPEEKVAEPVETLQDREEKKIGEFEIPITKESIEKIRYIEEMGMGQTFRNITKILMFIPQYLLAWGFCELLYSGHPFLAAFVLILFFDLSVFKTFASFIFKTFRK